MSLESAATRVAFAPPLPAHPVLPSPSFWESNMTNEQKDAVTDAISAALDAALTAVKEDLAEGRPIDVQGAANRGRNAAKTRLSRLSMSRSGSL
jgi:hypothetical protein